MKKAVKAAVFTALTTLALTAFASAEGEIAISAGCTTGTSLRLRSEPNTSASIVTTLNKSMAVALLDTSTPGWYKVDYNGNTGYVSSDYIAIDQDNLFTSYGRVPEGTVHVRAGASTDSASLATISAGTITNTMTTRSIRNNGRSIKRFKMCNNSWNKNIWKRCNTTTFNIK